MGQPFHFSRPRKRLPLPVLTARQEQFVNALIDGKIVAEIALEHGVCKNMVYQVLRWAMIRTGKRTRDQLVAWWAVERLKRETIAA